MKELIHVAGNKEGRTKFCCKDFMKQKLKQTVIFDEKNVINQIQSGEKGTLELKNPWATKWRKVFV